MGSSASEEIKNRIPIKNITTPYVMNTILNYMLKELNIRDFHTLSNPSTCNKYVLFMANNIYKHFYDLQLFPYRNEKRILLFRKVDDLVNPSDDERQSLCLVLSYYYVRIFQIYGALALTLISDVSFMTDSGLTTVLKKQYAPGHPQYVRGGGKELYYYSFIKSYIKDNIYDDEKGYMLKYSGTNSTKCTIYFTAKSHTNSNQYYGLFKLFMNDKKYYIESTITDTKESEYEFKITSIYYNKDDRRISIDTSNLSKIVVKKVSSDQYTMDKMSVENGFNTLFNTIVSIINKNNKEKDTLATTTESTGTIKELGIDEIIQNLSRVKPVGHCIARAMQLLRSEPLDNKYGVSNICKTKFFETVKGTSRSGIPEPGEPLSTSPGLSALANLFYDTVHVGTPKLQIGNKKIDGNETSLEQYIKFMKLMSIRFGDTINHNSTPKLEKIKNKRDKDVCKSMPENIYIPYNTSKEVNNLVNELISIQLTHAERCGKILLMLFNISSDSMGRFNIALSNNIIEKGFPEIDRINHYARDILIAYYSNCEYKYVEGMKLIVESRISVPNTIQPDIVRGKNVIRTLQERVYVPNTQPKQAQYNTIRLPQYNLPKPSLFQLPPTAPTAPTAPAAPTAPVPTAPAPTAPTAAPSVPNVAKAPMATKVPNVTKAANATKTPMAKRIQ